MNMHPSQFCSLVEEKHNTAFLLYNAIQVIKQLTAQCEQLEARLTELDADKKKKNKD